MSTIAPESTQDPRDTDHAEALADLAPGTVVTYHGTLTDEYCFEFVVMGFDPGHAGQRYQLFNREYPWSVLTRVRRTSIVPTGERLTLCEHCQHPHEQVSRHAVNVCAVSTCRCNQHAPHTEPAKGER